MKSRFRVRKETPIGVVESKQVTVLSAFYEQARMLYWVTRAKSTDMSRHVLCERFAVIKPESEGGKVFAVATDGRRLHACRLNEWKSEEPTLGVYRIILSTPRSVEAVLDTSGATYPNAWMVVPKVALCSEQGVFVPDVRGSNRDDSAVFKLFRQLDHATGKLIKLMYMLDVVNAMSGQTLWISSEKDDAGSPVMILNGKSMSEATMFAVIMPMRE